MSETPKKGSLLAFPSYEELAQKLGNEHYAVKLKLWKSSVEKWKLEHEKLDSEREDRILELIEQKHKLKRDTRAFLEWFESIPDIQDYMDEGVISKSIYEKKKKELLKE